MTIESLIPQIVGVLAGLLPAAFLIRYLLLRRVNSFYKKMMAQIGELEATYPAGFAQESFKKQRRDVYEACANQAALYFGKLSAQEPLR